MYVEARSHQHTPVNRPACGGCVHRRVCPFTETEKNTRRSAASLVSGTEVISSGERLYRTGAPVDALYFIRSGTFKVCAVAGDGTDQVVGFYGPGEIIGLNALSDGAYPYDAVALDTASVCTVPLEPLLGSDVMNNGFLAATDVQPFAADSSVPASPFASTSGSAGLSPALAAALLLNFSRAARRDENLRLMLARNSATERVAAFLLDMVANNRRRGLVCDQLLLPMSRADIASYLALAVETVSRVLTRLTQQGVVRVNRRRVDILDLGALERLTQQQPAAAEEGAVH